MLTESILRTLGLDLLTRGADFAEDIDEEEEEIEQCNNMTFDGIGRDQTTDNT